MTFTKPDGLSTATFVLILLYVLITYASWLRGSRRALIVLFAMLVAFTVVVNLGFGANRPVPQLPILLIATLCFCAFAALSKAGGQIAAAQPASVLIFFQAFRLPLELVLHLWSNQGTIPSTMTWSGQNFDIATGILAIPAFYFADQKRSVAWTFNLIGLALLLNVIRVVIFSSPLPFAWDVKPPLQLAFHFPYAYILPVCVGGALTAHLILFRKLLS